ncbi:VanZ family protein [Alkalibacter rhizosphaerae]|uniref:VanZ family protein n=1 Tax=Alkalibacter rhizosphaerae TaxID=2815577 RepID=A0A974XE57_9FIRM|nr:VanZ family protein [Alkalibacter rhizosphaerae]QSX08173.1 VanZ family protein [Alkalibacter rhizosphaerae]
MGEKKNSFDKSKLDWFFVIAWMTLIFIFSAQPATESAAMSGQILQAVQAMIQRILPGRDFDPGWVHFLIRKGAHLFVYAVLGVLTMRALIKSGHFTKHAWFTAFLICILYAAGDEWHQIYVPGRAGQITDVMVDGFGSMGGIFLVLSRNR